MSKMDKYLKHEEFYVLLLIFCFMLVETNINATTILMEAREDGDPLPVLMPFLLEYSSGLALLALVPLIGGAALQAVSSLGDGFARVFDTVVGRASAGIGGEVRTGQDDLEPPGSSWTNVSVSERASS